MISSPTELRSNVRVVSACRYCHSSELVDVLSLGSHPPSNSFIREEDIPRERSYPLEVALCRNCFLMQLRHVVAPTELFDDYLYLSSSSEALKLHYRRLVAALVPRFELRQGDLVVDIGCNDGILLHEYPADLVRVGVEPSRVAETARRGGLEVIQAFFDRTVAETIVATHGTAAVVTATNVFPHVDAIEEFTEALLPLLGDRGAFVIEASYLPDLVDQCLFDTVYHEHLCYPSLTSLLPFLERHGLEVFDVERVPIGASGPAFRVFAQRRGGTARGTRAPEETIAWERSWGVQNQRTYLRFAERVRETRQRLLGLLHELRARGARIGGYGAPAKGNTLLNYVGLDPSIIEMIAETNPLKLGLLTPASHIPIVSEEAFIEAMPDYALLLAWNYVEFFLQHSQYIRLGGRFIVPVPEPRILP